MKARITRRVLPALLTAVAGFALAAPSGAFGATTIGQTGDPDGITCVGQFDGLQPTVTSGNAYVVPSDGGVTAWTLTSWSHLAKPTPSGQMLTMKVFRGVASPDTYQVVGHDGPRAVTAGELNTFQTQLSVKAGDFLGLNSANAPTVGNGCLFPAPGDFGIRFREGDLADGTSGDFAPLGNALRANISAEITPTNTFTLGKITRNKKKGTAIELITAPNPGELTGSGNGVKASSAGQAMTSKSVGAGQAQLLIKAKGKRSARSTRPAR